MQFKGIKLTIIISKVTFTRCNFKNDILKQAMLPDATTMQLLYIYDAEHAKCKMMQWFKRQSIANFNKGNSYRWSHMKYSLRISI